MVENINLGNHAVFHQMGDPLNVFKFEKYKREMLQEYMIEYKKNDEEFNKLFNFECLGDFETLYELYFYIVTSKLLNNNKYKIGDWFYIEDRYETRQWFGIGRISYDLKENKKTLLYYGEDTPYKASNKINNDIFPRWLQNKINEKKDFDKYAAEDYIKYIFPEECLEY